MTASVSLTLSGSAEQQSDTLAIDSRTKFVVYQVDLQL